MNAVSQMNLFSRILIGAIVIAVCAVVWHLLTLRNSGKRGCSGDCGACSQPCDRSKRD